MDTIVKKLKPIDWEVFYKKQQVNRSSQPTYPLNPRTYNLITTLSTLSIFSHLFNPTQLNSSHLIPSHSPSYTLSNLLRIHHFLRIIFLGPISSIESGRQWVVVPQSSRHECRKEKFPDVRSIDRMHESFDVVARGDGGSGTIERKSSRRR